jgi:hypothetical protein
MTTRHTFNVKMSGWYADVRLLQARTEGASATTANPYIQSSQTWMAFEVGRKHGIGPIAPSRGASVKFISQCGGFEHVVKFDELYAQVTR